MPYTEADFERMETDPDFRRQYFWRCAMNAKRTALQMRNNKDLECGVLTPENLEDTCNFILENIDLLVEHSGGK